MRKIVTASAKRAASAIKSAREIAERRSMGGDGSDPVDLTQRQSATATSASTKEPSRKRKAADVAVDDSMDSFGMYVISERCLRMAYTHADLRTLSRSAKQRTYCELIPQAPPVDVSSEDGKKKS